MADIFQNEKTGTKHFISSRIFVRWIHF